MKKRFLANGERAFDDYQLLELLLFYSVPQVDTNPIAHRLLERFHSLSAVMEASVEELMTVDGVGEHTAVLIQLLPQFARRYHQDRVKMDSAVNRMEDAGTLLAPYFYGAKREMVYLLSLDARGRVLGCDLLGEGSANFCTLDIGWSPRPPCAAGPAPSCWPTAMCPAWPYPRRRTGSPRSSVWMCWTSSRSSCWTTWSLPTETTSPWPSPACCGGNRPILVRKTKVSVNPFQGVPDSKGSAFGRFPQKAKHPNRSAFFGVNCRSASGKRGLSARRKPPSPQNLFCGDPI